MHVCHAGGEYRDEAKQRTLLLQSVQNFQNGLERFGMSRRCRMIQKASECETECIRHFVLDTHIAGWMRRGIYFSYWLMFM